MTNLDAKALEAAEAEFSECCSMPMQLAIKRTVTAYLDALPPARQAWAHDIGDGAEIIVFKDDYSVKRHLEPNEQTYKVEIREVRAP